MRMAVIIRTWLSEVEEMDTLDALKILPGYKEKLMPNMIGSG